MAYFVVLTTVIGCAGTDSRRAALSEHSPIDAANRPPNTRRHLERATNPDEAARWRNLIRQDERGEIAQGALHRALEQRVVLLAQAAPRGGQRVAGIDPAEWVERGPRNVGGRSRALIVDPTNTNRLLAGSVSGGIWVSENAGATWSPVDDGLPNLAIGCMAIDPSNPSVMYAGTGEGFFNGDAIGGTGIYKSTDGGQSWSLLAATSTWDNVCRIAVSPANSNIILAARRYGGIHRSTNGGANWSVRLNAQGSFYIAFDPTDGNKAVGHIIDYDWGLGDWYHRAVYSTNGGFTWATASGDMSRQNGFGSRIELAYAPSSPNVVYASCATGGGRIWKSTDGGQSYTLQTGSGSSGVSWYANPLWVDPTNPNFLVTGGYNFYKSTDGGASLTQISDGYIMTLQPHVDMHAIVHDPNFDGVTNRRVYVCTDGGVWKTDNIYTASTSSGWLNLDVDYRTTQYYGAAGDGNSGLIIGGTQDNGTLRIASGSDMGHLMFGGDGGFCAIDWQNPNYCYGEYINLRIVRSSNGGTSAGYITNGLADAGVAANFIAPFILDPNNPARLLAGGLRLWRCPNARAAPAFIVWQQIRPAGTDNISAIAVAPGNPDLIWIGQNNGEVHRTTNGTAASPTWEPIDNNGAPNPLPNRYVTRIVVDPDDHDLIYVTLGGFANDNLWASPDGGGTWVPLGNVGPDRLPSAPIRGFARHPRKANWLYAGTEVGIFASENGGSTWTTTHTGPSAVSMDELVFMHQSETLLAATHGRGIYTIAVPSCLLLGDINQDGMVDAGDVAGFVRAKLGTPLPDDEETCADYETGAVEGDTIQFVNDLLGS